MNRQTATAVLREILEACRGLIETNYLSLEPSDARIRKNSDFELQIKLSLTDVVRRCIDPVLEKYKLSIKESRGIVTIYSPS
jgi:hypothetical protein